MKYTRIKEELRNYYNHYDIKNEIKKQELKQVIVNTYSLSDYIVRDKDGNRTFNQIATLAKVKSFNECATISERAINRANYIEYLLHSSNSEEDKEKLLKAKASFELINEWISLEVLYGMELAKITEKEFSSLADAIYNYSVKILMNYLKETQNIIKTSDKRLSYKK